MNGKINLNATIETKDHDGYKAIKSHDLMWSLSMEQYELVYCQTPEGQSDDFSWKIRLNNWFTGSSYILNQTVYGKIRCETFEEDGYSEDHVWYQNGRTTAENLINKMKAKGEIDLQYWTLID